MLNANDKPGLEDPAISFRPPCLEYYVLPVNDSGNGQKQGNKASGMSLVYEEKIHLRKHHPNVHVTDAFRKLSAKPFPCCT
jgi:hypothetical protein